VQHFDNLIDASSSAQVTGQAPGMPDKIVTNKSVYFRVFRVFRGSSWLRVLPVSPPMKTNLDFGHYPKVELERLVAARGRYDYTR
jgi:hypothetical protein